MIHARADPLRAAGYSLQAMDWLAADRNELTRRNLNVEMHGPGAEPTPDGLLAAVPDATLILTHFAPVAKVIVEAGRHLVVIGVARAGRENIAAETATERGIPVVQTLGRNANAVAELTPGLILCEMRNLARAHCAVRSGVWYNRHVDPHTCFELSGKTVGLVGFGSIGRRLTRRLSGFDVRLLVCDPSVPESAIQEAGGVSVSLDQLLRQSEIVSLHARLMPETQGLIGRQELARMQPNAYLINTARAGLIDQNALVEAL